MDTKFALIGIVVDDMNAVEKLNSLLHDYAPYIIGRMGLPYEKRKISIISVAIDAPVDKIDALSEALAAMDGVRTNPVYARAVL